MLSKEHAQLCAVFLHMTQIVQLKLRKGELSPGKPAQTVGLLVGQSTNRLLALSAAVFQVAE